MSPIFDQTNVSASHDSIILIDSPPEAKAYHMLIIKYTCITMSYNTSTHTSAHIYRNIKQFHLIANIHSILCWCIIIIVIAHCYHFINTIWNTHVCKWAFIYFNTFIEGVPSAHIYTLPSVWYRCLARQCAAHWERCANLFVHILMACRSIRPFVYITCIHNIAINIHLPHIHTAASVAFFRTYCSTLYSNNGLSNKKKYNM